MSIPPPGIKYTCWAFADDWKPGFIMLGANVNAIPAPPPQSAVIIGTDGLWGAHEWTIYPQPYRHEFPYLAWIPMPSPNPFIPSDVLTRSVEKTMWQAHSHKPNTRVINPTLLDPFTTISSDPSFSSVQHPTEASIRASAALSRLENDFWSLAGFVEVFRSLQRSLLELRAFLSWWKDARASDDSRSPVHVPTRGSIFFDKDLFTSHARWSVAAFLLVHKSMFVLDPVKKVVLSPRTLCKARPMSPQPLLHSLHLWYYPPLVQDIMMDLESSSWGYAERLDTFSPTKVFKRTLDKIENKRNDEAGRRAKMAKVTQSSHLELRRLTDAAPTPDWFPKPHEIWLDAMNYVSQDDLASTVSPRRFSLPPVHLFWGSNEQKQRTYYHHFFVLHHAIRQQVSRLPPLTTQEWRSVLGNTYWKQQWPKPDGNVPSQDSTFDPNAFWRHSGPLFFGDELSAEIVAGRHNPTSTLPCRCVVRMDTADDPDIRQVALYHLSLLHASEEAKEMERLYFPDNPQKTLAISTRSNDQDGGPMVHDS
ncbi:hypothetical protein BJY52DRAFT_1186313 [Lactarius psammicola]|nr:hypothetical protein BJY52DRAFT_1186313 [Lactarius psammicola]